MNYHANKLARQGRNGDTRVAHLTEGEVVIPREVAQLRPDLIAHVSDQLRRMGGNPQQMVVGRGRRNPKTGMEEFATEAEVRAAYRQVLGREPDAAGLQYWMQPSSGFSPEVFAVAAQPEQRVVQSYQNVLGRAPEQEGLQYWVDQKRQGMSPEQFNTAFAVAAQPEIARQRQTMQQQINDLQSQFDRQPMQPPIAPGVQPPPLNGLTPAPIAPPTPSNNRPTGTTGLINWTSMGQPNMQIATTIGTIERPEMRPTQLVNPAGLISSQMQLPSGLTTAQAPQFLPSQNPNYISDVDLELLNRQRQGSVLDRFGVYNPYNMPQR